jgi:hypothetical protein
LTDTEAPGNKEPLWKRALNYISGNEILRVQENLRIKEENPSKW